MRHFRQHRQHTQILGRVIRQLGVDGVGGVQADGAHHQRVAVSRLVHHIFAAQVATRAGLVFHHHRHIPQAPQLIRQHAGLHVGATTGRERHQDAHLPAGRGEILLRLGAGARQTHHRHHSPQHGIAACPQTPLLLHVLLLFTAWGGVFDRCEAV